VPTNLDDQGQRRPLRGGSLWPKVGWCREPRVLGSWRSQAATHHQVSVAWSRRRAPACGSQWLKVGAGQTPTDPNHSKSKEVDHVNIGVVCSIVISYMQIIKHKTALAEDGRLSMVLF
jgi:hypothetical protein